MNQTGDLSLCSWTTLQSTTKADADGLAVILKLLYILYDKSSIQH